MELILNIDGEKKSFKQPDAVLALRVKQALDFATDLDKEFDPQKLKRIVDFISYDLYEGKFTSDEFWAGMDASELIPNIQKCLSIPFNKIYKSMEPLKN